MRVVATIEARMTSKRLPGKVMLMANKKPMLYYLVKRLRKVPSLQAIVLAITVNPEDDILAEFAKVNGILCHRGSEENVMQRVIEAAEVGNADVIVEITADCPLIDPEIVEQTIQLFLCNSCDYASNVQVRSYPIGMDTQVYRLETLKKSYSMTDHPLDREHVTRHIRLSGELFKQLNLVAPPSCHWPELSLTLDEKLDYELISRVIEYFADSPYFTCAEIITLLKEKHCEWANINAQVIRKGLHT